ncbi:MAG: glycosyltransferase family 39 protein [Chloroflexi bacterium]|nr:glycosyltransferase family 39 protein [Chloroflexota bacterium]
MQMNSPNALRFMLVVAALLLGVLGQALLSTGQIQWSVTPFVVAAVAIALSVANRPLSFLGTPASVREANFETKYGETPGGSHSRFRKIERRWSLGTLALGGVFLGFSLFLFPKGPPNTLAWYLYGLSIIVLAVSVAGLDGRWTALLRAWRSRARVSVGMHDAMPWVGLAAVVILALIVRLVNLQELPAGLWFDEADNINQARHILSDPGNTLVFVPSTNLPSLFLLPIALVIELAGVSITTARLVSVAFGVAGVMAIFLLTRLALGSGLALIAAFLTAVMRWDINWSRIGMHGITGPLFGALTGYLLLKALRSERPAAFAFAGATLGLGMWFYASFRLFPLVIAFMILHRLVLGRSDRRRLIRNVLLMGVAAFIVAAPVVQSAIVDSEEFFSRTTDTSVFSLYTPGEALDQVWTGLGKHALMFNYKGDPNPRHNLPGAPMLDFLSGMLMILGMGVAFARWRNVALVVMPFWILFMMMPGVITLPFEAPQSLRSIVVIPAVVVLITLALAAVWWAGRSAPWRPIRRATPLFLALLLAVIAISNLSTYFGAQASNPEVYASFSTDETLMAPHMLQQQRRGYSLFVSRQFLFSLTATLLANNPRLETIAAPINIPLDPAKAWLGASIYLEPREAGFYDVLKAYYPDAEFREFRPPAGGEPLFYSAVISRAQLERDQGILERITLDSGVVKESTKYTTESLWPLEVGPEDVPFDVTWEGSLHVVRPGEYVLELVSDGDTEVFLDGQTVLTSEQPSVKIVPAVGLHSLELKARVEDPDGTLRLLWRPPGGELVPIPKANLYHGSIRPLGLAGRFFKDGEEVGAAVADASRITPVLDTFWYEPVLEEPYRAVWEGELAAHKSGGYRFDVEGFGELKLYIDDRLVAAKPGGLLSAPDDVSRLRVGRHSIRLEYFSQFPPSEFEVFWTPPDEPRATIPLERLSPKPEAMFRVVE